MGARVSTEEMEGTSTSFSLGDSGWASNNPTKSISSEIVLYKNSELGKHVI